MALVSGMRADWKNSKQVAGHFMTVSILNYSGDVSSSLLYIISSRLVNGLNLQIRLDRKTAS